jgi:hypothetical protein
MLWLRNLLLQVQLNKNETTLEYFSKNMLQFQRERFVLF